jgi:hypothetical protein
MADTRFPPLKREPLLEEELPSANPNVRLVKALASNLRPGNRLDCIVIRSRPWGW